MGSFSERRQTIRIAVHGNLQVETVTAGQALKLVDVGMGGFSVRSELPMPVDVVTSFRLATADRKWSAIFRARAVHSQLQPSEAAGYLQYVTGMMFENVDSPAAQRELIAMMEAEGRIVLETRASIKARLQAAAEAAKAGSSGSEVEGLLADRRADAQLESRRYASPDPPAST